MNETWVTITGWVGSVVAKDLAAGGRLVTLRVATTPRRLVEGAWVDGTTAWHTVKAWRHLADQVADGVSTGDPVVVHGRVVAEEWQRSDGTVGCENVVVAAAVGLDLARVRPARETPAPDTSPDDASEAAYDEHAA